MIVETVQRWRDRRDHYRPIGEPIRTADYEVSPLASDTRARAFVVAHHYSGSYPAAQERIALYRRGECVGIAVFSVPMHPGVLASLPEPSSSTELGRFVLLDDVPANGESWFLARAFELLVRTGYSGVVADSDPMPRQDASGRTVFAGHIGTIYQASNAVYLGVTARRTKRFFPDGSVLVGRAWSKLRTGERGHRYVEARLLAAGAEPRAAHDPPREWCARWVGALTRPVRHPGNHRYLFGLDRATRRALPSSRPYPKLSTRAA